VRCTRSHRCWIVLIIAVSVFLTVLPFINIERKQDELLFNLPPALLRVMSFQFKEVVSDIAFLNVLTHLSEMRTQEDTKRYLPEQYEWIFKSLNNSVALDPYFADPYNLLNSSLIWDQYKTSEVNTLIAKGADLRSWDYLLAFYTGFNYYYFLDDYEKSFVYFKQASQRSGGNPFYDRLASKVAYQANKTDLAIEYLEEQILNSEKEGRNDVSKSLNKRLLTLKGIRRIELSIESYQKKYGKYPSSIDELIIKGLLDSLPPEPSGGRYFIDKLGRVRSDKDLN